MSDLQLSASFKQLEGPSDIGFGLMFRGKQTDGYDVFMITADGRFTLIAHNEVSDIDTSLVT